MRNFASLSNLLLLATLAWPQTKPSPRWEELTAADFRTAIQQSEGTCMLPFGIIEKHGPHLPLGTDLFNVRHVVLAAVDTDFAVVFPEYYFGQILEARHEPGTVAYSISLQLQLLQETTDEMARNGCKKVIVVNGHGGNEHLLPLFAQAQLEKPRDYVVYVLPLFDAPPNPAVQPEPNGHAGVAETSEMLVARPDLVHIERARQESGADLARLKLPDPLYTGIWWYSSFPDHYAGDGAKGTREIGEFDLNAWTAAVQKVIRAVKADHESLRLQNEFFEKAKHPLDTLQ